MIPVNVSRTDRQTHTPGCMHVCTQRPEEDVRFSTAGATGGWELHAMGEASTPNH